MQPNATHTQQRREDEVILVEIDDHRVYLIPPGYEVVTIGATYPTVEYRDPVYPTVATNVAWWRPVLLRKA